MSARLWTGIALVALAAATAGCDTEAYCFADCADEPTGGSTETGSGTGDGGAGGFSPTTGEGGCLINCSGTTGAGGSGGCEQTNGGIEICDGVDNDCNGTADEGFDFTAPQTCGTCANSCLVELQNCAIAGIVCGPSPDPGNQPGECSCTECDSDYFDLDGDGKSCEYYCVAVGGSGDATCDSKDDDCDGVKDEDVDVCTSTTDCGKCGGNCVVLHGTPECVHTGPMPCDSSNTQCAIQSCTCNGPGDCWHDLDNSYATGCEYQCDLTNGGVEICGDGVDNDCDGLIDGTDDLSGDPQIGVVCFGDPDGECATAAHAGTTQCVGALVTCTGANVIVENQVTETCNAKDDDCDGVVDDAPSDAGGFCGMSNVFPCSFGTQQCQNGALACVGAVNPGTETCNGVDDDCDGTVDASGGNPPADSMGACNVPVPPPPGVPSPCMAGTKACVAGGVVCQGAVGPTGPSDACGVDSNCDGALTSQPNLQSDVGNCGTCGNNCYAGAVHSNWACTAGVCQFQGCQPGWFDLNNDQQCEYACAFVSAQEACNGNDDDCDGQIDEGVIAPSPVQICGVSPSATTPECTSGVTVACQMGAWKCTFPAGVCNPTCAGTSEICDALDNDCDGLLNENVANYGKPCASDDAAPVPGHGACRTTGTNVCNGPNAVACSAVKADCATLPGGCTELCDGIDNDCDGSTDETYQAKGTVAAHFVKPAVTRIGNSLWTYQFEASRPNATTTVPGTGNGYHCNQSPCPGSAPVAPAGVPLQKTKACSVQGKIPWFNVTPIEVEQTCNAIGGRICTVAEWTDGCDTNPPSATTCNYGYAPLGAACTTVATAAKFCNLGPTFDFSPGTPGDQDGLLVTGSPSLQNCFGDWQTLLMNGAAAGKLFDVTGNLREITKDSSVMPAVYRLMGGAFSTGVETGATCQFNFYTSDQSFQLYDLGFRCCFTQNPTL